MSAPVIIGPSKRYPVPPGKAWMRAQIWAAWFRSQLATDEKGIRIRPAGAADLAYLLDKASTALAPQQPKPAAAPSPTLRLGPGDPPPANKHYPHFESGVGATERRRVWVAWLKTRKGAKIGPEGVLDLIALLNV